MRQVQSQSLKATSPDHNRRSSGGSPKHDRWSCGESPSSESPNHARGSSGMSPNSSLKHVRRSPGVSPNSSLKHGRRSSGVPPKGKRRVSAGAGNESWQASKNPTRRHNGNHLAIDRNPSLAPVPQHDGAQPNTARHDDAQPMRTRRHSVSENANLKRAFWNEVRSLLYKHRARNPPLGRRDHLRQICRSVYDAVKSVMWRSKIVLMWEQTVNATLEVDAETTVETDAETMHSDNYDVEDAGTEHVDGGIVTTVLEDLLNQLNALSGDEARALQRAKQAAEDLQAKLMELRRRADEQLQGYKRLSMALDRANGDVTKVVSDLKAALNQEWEGGLPPIVQRVHRTARAVVKFTSQLSGDLDPAQINELIAPCAARRAKRVKTLSEKKVVDPSALFAALKDEEEPLPDTVQEIQTPKHVIEEAQNYALNAAQTPENVLTLLTKLGDQFLSLGRSAEAWIEQRPRITWSRSQGQSVTAALGGPLKANQEKYYTACLSFKDFVEQKEAEQSLTVNFSPGGLGLMRRDATVTGVFQEGQAQKQGVRVGMRMTRIGGQQFSGELLEAKASGTEDYEVGFDEEIQTPTHVIEEAQNYALNAAQTPEKVLTLLTKHGDQFLSLGHSAEKWIEHQPRITWSRSQGQSVTAALGRPLKANQEKYYAACLSFKDFVEQKEAHAAAEDTQDAVPPACSAESDAVVDSAPDTHECVPDPEVSSPTEVQESADHGKRFALGQQHDENVRYVNILLQIGNSGKGTDTSQPDTDITISTTPQDTPPQAVPNLAAANYLKRLTLETEFFHDHNADGDDSHAVASRTASSTKSHSHLPRLELEPRGLKEAELPPSSGVQPKTVGHGSKSVIMKPRSPVDIEFVEAQARTGEHTQRGAPWTSMLRHTLWSQGRVERSRVTVEAVCFTRGIGYGQARRNFAQQPSSNGVSEPRLLTEPLHQKNMTGLDGSSRRALTRQPQAPNAARPTLMPRCRGKTYGHQDSSSVYSQLAAFPGQSWFARLPSGMEPNFWMCRQAENNLAP